MATQEVNSQAVIDLVEETLGFQSQKGRREASRVRNERMKAFLKTADRLLQAHGYDHTEEGKQPERLTNPIDVLIGDRTLQVQVVKRTITANGGNEEGVVVKAEIRYTAILATDPSTGIKYRLFGAGNGNGCYE